MTSGGIFRTIFTAFIVDSEWVVFWVSVKELNTLHDKHLNRPTLDDSVDEEHSIEILTRDITQV